MVLQKIYVQYYYKLHGYFLPNAKIGVDGDSFYEECDSAFDGISTGCGFNLIAGNIYDTATTKDGYYLTGESILLDFTAPVEPYILLWLFPREPTVVTHAATEVAATSVRLNGELTDLDGLEATDVCFQYGKVGELYTTTTEWTYYAPDPFSYNITGLAPDTTYNFRTRANNITEEDTFYVFGETKQFTTLPTTEPPVVYTYDTGEITESGALLRGYLGTSGGVNTDIGFEYGETTSYGTTVWTDMYTAPGYYEEAITGVLEPDTLYHVRAIATNAYGTGYGADKTFTTVVGPTHNMQLVFPNPYGLLFEDHTIIACVDPARACTLFTFQIENIGDVAMGAWYKVSIVGGTTLYESTIPPLDPGVTSAVIDDYVCAIPPGGLPIGTHTIQVEVGPEGKVATDSYTEDIFVIEEGGTPPSGAGIDRVHYLNVCGAEIENNCASVDIFVEQFGSDNECSICLEYWSEGDTEHNFTTPIIVPYDPIYDEEGFGIQGIEICIQECERDLHIRAVASNGAGTSYSEIETPITVRLEVPTEITQTSITLNADIVSMGSVTNGVASFRYGTPTPNTTAQPLIPFSNIGPISYTITGLMPNTTYQYHFFARYTYGYPQTYSTTLSFTTLPESFDITFVATAPGISDLHNVDVTDVTNPQDPKYLGRT